MKHWISRRSASMGWSGDFVECIPLTEHRHAIVVGDVAGHDHVAGHAAAVLAAYTRRLIVERLAPSMVLQRTCNYFMEHVLNDATLFASVFIAVTDLFGGTLRYASAGHGPALLCHASGTHEHLDPTGPVLGIGVDTTFGEVGVHVPHDSLLVVVTDGITEARREEQDRLAFFGTRGVVAAVRDAARDGRDPAEVVGRSALAHANGVLADDATVFVSTHTRVQHASSGKPIGGSMKTVTSAPRG